MKTLERFLFLIIILSISITACSLKDNVDTDSAPDLVSVKLTEDDIINGLSDQEKCWMNITQQQYVEDFDQLYTEIQDNYPYCNVVLRKAGFNLEEEYGTYRTKIQSCTNDYDFVNTIREFIKGMDYVGHISSWGYRYMSQVESLKDFIVQFPDYKEQLTPYLTKLDNPVSQRNYQAMQEFYQNIESKTAEAKQTTESTQSTGTGQEDIVPPNVQTQILQDGKTAYVKINGFDMDAYQQDKDILLPFYQSIMDYENLIIDITDNYGGGMDYFNDLIVSPLIDRSLTVTGYLLCKSGQNNKDILRLDEEIEQGKWKPVQQLPALPKLNQDDLSQMDYFMQEDYIVEPLNKQQAFSGKIWLLVSHNNYSSSEYAAMFSKYSGFATLVGEQTGGDGIGVDPAYIILNNSGLVVQYSPVYGITEDGTGSEEFGTTPDIISPENESALDTCLKEISSAK